MTIRRRKLPYTSFLPQDEVMDNNDGVVAREGAKHLKDMLKKLV